MIVIGIDPGITGAVVSISEHGSVCFFDTPTTPPGSGRREFLPVEMADILYEFKNNSHVFIEKVHSMPGQGVASMFSFGMGYGIWIGIVAALKIPYSLVTPQSWKKDLMQGMKDKDASRLRAQQLLPWETERLKRKKDVGRADAFLIAEYGRRVLSK